MSPGGSVVGTAPPSIVRSFPHGSRGGRHYVGCMSSECRDGVGTTEAWLAAWVGGAGIGVANGAARELTYGRALSEPVANRISALTGTAAFLAYFDFLQRRGPLRSRPQALLVGGAWTVLTVGFEFGLGRARGKEWRELTAEYDLSRGRLWPLVLLTVALGPELARVRSR
jgi:hypothetical protein